MLISSVDLTATPCPSASLALECVKRGLLSRSVGSHKLNERFYLACRNLVLYPSDLFVLSQELTFPLHGGVLNCSEPCVCVEVRLMSKYQNVTESLRVVCVLPSSGEYRRFGKVTFVDLAGSERLSASESAGSTRVETAQINKSLFALGKVGRFPTPELAQ